VDIDDAAAFASAGLSLPPTASQTTVSGGSHHLYATDGRPVAQTVKAVPGADTRVGGRGFVGVYSADAFSGEVAPAPEWVYGLKAVAAPVATEGPISSRAEIVGLAGRLRYSGMDADEIASVLVGRLHAGTIYDTDDLRPWEESDLEAIAKDIGSKQPGEWARTPTVTKTKDGIRSRGRVEDSTPPAEVIQSMADYVASHGDEDIDWLIDGIAARGIVSLLAGPMKGGKTTLLENALRLVGGSDEFLGRWTVAPHRALLLTEEGAVTIRLNMAHLDVDVVSRRDKVPSTWTLQQTVDACLWWLESNPGGLVIVDTYDKWADVRDENDNAANVAAIRAFYAIVEAGGGVLLVHHSRKGGGEYGEGIRGAGAILGAVDHAVELKHISPGSDRRRLEMHGRVLEDTRRLLDFDRATMTYRVVDEDEEENASLLMLLEGIPTKREDPDGMSAGDLAALWNLRQPKRRIEDLVAAALLTRSDDLVKVGRGKEWRYWRSTATVAPTHNRGTTVAQEARATVRGDAP
jgi:hypothetical protein